MGSPSELPAQCPEWLTVGARVLVVPCGRSRTPRKGRVSYVEWPWLVALDGEPGAVHPLRILPDYATP